MTATRSSIARIQTIGFLAGRLLFEHQQKFTYFSMKTIEKTATMFNEFASTMYRTTIW